MDNLNSNIMANVIKGELRRFCEHSTVRGLPRVFKAESHLLKVIWIVALTLFLGANIWQLIHLLGDYLAYQVTTTIKEDVFIISATVEDEVNIMPDVTICNFSPFKSDHNEIAKKLNITTFTEYHERYAETLPKIHEELVKWAKETNRGESVPKVPKASADMMYEQVASMMGQVQNYVSFIGPEAAKELVQSLDELVVSCFVLLYSGSTVHHMPCYKGGTFHPIALHNRQNCYTFRPNGTFTVIDTTLYNVGIELTLYLDNFLHLEPPGYVPIPDDEEGGLVYIHPRDVYPGSLHYESRAITASPGHHLRVPIYKSSIRRLEEPYSNCYNYMEKREKVYSCDSVEYLFDLETCKLSCLQEKIMYNCSCYDRTVAILPQGIATTTLPPCGSKEGSQVKDFVDQSFCIILKAYAEAAECAVSCRQSCEESTVSTESYITAWPKKNGQLRFYENQIVNKSYASKFSIYGNISSLYRDGHTDEAQQILSRVRLIEDNFVKITLYSASSREVVFEEIPKSTWNELLANIGGTFNLYVGITLPVIVEIVELVFRLLFR